MESEIAAFPVIDRDAGDVGRQQIARELDALIAEPENPGQRMGEGVMAI
jgi:hypothetical protein